MVGLRRYACAALAAGGAALSLVGDLESDVACLERLLVDPVAAPQGYWTAAAGDYLARGDWSCAFTLSTLVHRHARNVYEAAAAAGDVPALVAWDHINAMSPRRRRPRVLGDRATRRGARRAGTRSRWSGRSRGP